MNTDVLLDKLTRAIAFKYREDKTVPGLTVAALKKGYYCSVVRYSGAFAKGKVVVCSARGNTLSTALKGVAEKFLTTAKVAFDPLQELGEIVRNVKLNG
jgi:hypothetical protein